jgi:uncharacterized protein YyaL (SSP411 family)
MHRLLKGSCEVVVVGDRPDLVDVLRGSFDPLRTIAWGEPFDSPLWVGRSEPAAYVCRDYACQLPATTPEDLRARLASFTTS